MRNRIIYLLTILMVTVGSCNKDDFLNDKIEGFIIISSGGSTSPRIFYLKDLYTGDMRLLENEGICGLPRAGKIVCLDSNNILFFLNAQTHDTIFKKELPYRINGFTLSPDEKELIFKYSPNTIRKLDLSTLEQTDLIIPSELKISFYLWNVVNDKIYFTTYDEESRIGKICSINPDGSDFKIITNGSFFSDLSISPDGKTIAYMHLYSLYLIDINGSNKRDLWEGVLHPHWSKDGTAIMANFRNYIDLKTSRWDIRLKEISGRQRETIVVSENYSLIDWFFE